MPNFGLANHHFVPFSNAGGDGYAAVCFKDMPATLQVHTKDGRVVCDLRSDFACAVGRHEVLDLLAGSGDMFRLLVRTDERLRSLCAESDSEQVPDEFVGRVLDICDELRLLIRTLEGRVR